ncbi:MAG: carboxypeptidase regulatory-like domain-containing protein [Edaphobacter sp.]
MSFRATLKIVLLFFMAWTPMIATAQQTGATVHGLVADPEQAVIPGATVTLTPSSGKPLVAQSQSDGTYVLRGVAPGTYSMTVTMQGFASFVKTGIRITAGQNLTQDAKLAIQEQKQEVNVTASTAQVSVDADSNASSTILKGADLDALSDDPDELSSELTALAGPAAGPNGGQIYVDGFTGGQLPPKSSIREIRINQNPFSAQYDRLGYGRVEIFTKPGTDKFHGQFNLQGITSALNSGNPLLNAFNSPGQTPETQPPYHTIFVLGNITGPLAKNASFTLSGSHRAIQDNNLVSATVLSGDPIIGEPFTCPATGPSFCNYAIANPEPQSRTDINPRVDLALGEKNTLVTRFQYVQNDQNNLGVGGLFLPSTGQNQSFSETTVQMSDTQVLSQRIINETRFEFQRDSTTQTALSTAPTVTVNGGFTGGGSNNGGEQDHQIHLEEQNYSSIQLAKNFIRFGGRLRSTRDANSTTAGENGEFIYNCLEQSLCPTGSTASYQAGMPSQVQLVQVLHPVTATVWDLGLYAEDDWKAKPNLSISYGIRFETQNHLSGNHDFAPRVSLRYGVGAKNNPKTVLNAGFGIFYDRYMLANVMNVLESNGLNQIQTQLSTIPAGCSPENIAACTGGTGTGGNKTYSQAPNLRAPYTLHYAFGVDQQLFRGATLSVNYIRADGVHQFYSYNANSPIGGNSTSGFIYPIQPAPGSSPLVQDTYESGAVFRQNQLIANLNIRPSRIYSISGYGVLNYAKSDSGGLTSFPSIDPYDIGKDFGRAVFDIRYRLFVFGSLNLPHAILISPIVIFSAGTPYNITTGTDQNGDGQYNDRPAAALSTNETGAKTIAGCGSFVTPTPGTAYTPVPINLCTGPSQFTTNVRLTKTFGFGPPTGPPARPDGGGGNNRGPGPGGVGGPGGARGGGGGNPGGGRGGFGGAGSTGRRYNLALGVQVLNLFNNQDVSTPIGTLTSKQFGQSTQLAGMPFTSNSALRRVTLQMGFTF